MCLHILYIGYPLSPSGYDLDKFLILFGLSGANLAKQVKNE